MWTGKSYLLNYSYSYYYSFIGHDDVELTTSEGLVYTRQHSVGHCRPMPSRWPATWETPPYSHTPQLTSHQRLLDDKEARLSTKIPCNVLQTSRHRFRTLVEMYVKN